MTDYRSDMFFGALTGNGRILVVDDEPAIRKACGQCSKRPGTTSRVGGLQVSRFSQFRLVQFFERTSCFGVI